jgi:hypothetical protein
MEPHPLSLYLSLSVFNGRLLPLGPFLFMTTAFVSFGAFSSTGRQIGNKYIKSEKKANGQQRTDWKRVPTGHKGPTKMQISGGQIEINAQITGGHVIQVLVSRS